MIVNDQLEGLPVNCIGPVFPTRDGDAMSRILGIGREDRVLEIGGGFYPFSRADVITDLSFSDASNRNGAQMMFRPDKTYVECPAESLPFRDGEFDFAFCAHVLEHTEQPARALREMMRVAPRGYLEVPTAFSDYVSGNPTHRWLITLEEGVLTFRRRNFMENPLKNFLHARIVNDSEFAELVHHRFRNLLNLQVAWQGEIPFRIVEPSGENGFDYEDPVQAGWSHLLFAHNLHRYGADPKYAVADAYEATRYLPGSADAWMVRGLYDARMLLLKEAREDFRRALELRADDSTLKHNLAIVERCLEQGTFDPSQLAAPPISFPLEGATDSAEGEEPLVSILFDATGDHDSFDEAFQSILAQRYSNREVVLLTSDPVDAQARLGRLRAGFPVEILPVDAAVPLGARLNLAQSKCGGKYVAYLVNGAIWYVHHLARLVDFLEGSDLAAGYSDAMWLRFKESDGRKRYEWASQSILSPELRIENLARNEPIPVSNLIHAREIFAGFDPNLDRLLGRDLLLRISLVSPVDHLKWITTELREPKEELESPAEQIKNLVEQRKLIDNYSHFEPLELMRRLVELQNENTYLRSQLEQLQKS